MRVHEDRMKDNVNRANYIAGHVKAVGKMIEGNKYCIEVIHQLDAAEAAIVKLRQKILEEHLNTCVVDVIKGRDSQKRDKAVRELLKVYERS